MKQRPSLLTIIQSKRKAVYAFFAVTIFLLLVIAIPVALKTRSSRQSGSAQMSENGAILGTSNQTSIQSNAVEPIPSLNPTMYRFWDDDTVSNSGDSIHYLRQSSASPSDVHQRENRTLAPRGISFSPSYVPSDMPTASPSSQPSASPSTAPSGLPTVQSNELSGVNISFIPGLLTHIEFGLLLSSGLTARPLAVSGQRVEYTDGSRSSIPFHSLPDAGATFSRSDGGWVYVNNAEVDTENGGGVGALTFDGQGNIIDYKMVLENT